MTWVRRRHDHTFWRFLKRTIAAQSHLIGCLAAIAGCIALVHASAKYQSSSHFFACLVFGVTSILVFATSAAYHFLNDGYILTPRAAQWLEDLDHFAIYLFIAGSYTPFLINVVRPPWNHILMVVIWGTGILGILYTHFKPRLPKWAQHRFVYTGIFLVMGWGLLIRLEEIINNLSWFNIFLLVAGGASYSLGAVIYALKRPRLFVGVFGFHELWHIMVMLGFGFHYFLIFNFYRS